METSSSVLWTRNGIPVQTGKSKFLYIKSINRTDAGNYICVSLSPDGNHSSPITTVDVLCKLVLYYDLVWTEQLLKNLLRMFIFSNMFLVFFDFDRFVSAKNSTVCSFQRTPSKCAGIFADKIKCKLKFSEISFVSCFNLQKVRIS